LLKYKKKSIIEDPAELYNHCIKMTVLLQPVTLQKKYIKISIYFISFNVRLIFKEQQTTSNAKT